MIIKILSADLRITVCVGIVTPAHNARFRNIRREKVTKPVDIAHRPGVLTVSIEAVDGYNTVISS